MTVQYVIVISNGGRTVYLPVGIPSPDWSYRRPVTVFHEPNSLLQSLDPGYIATAQNRLPNESCAGTLFFMLVLSTLDLRNY